MKTLASLNVPVLLLTLAGAPMAFGQEVKQDETVYLACDRDGDPALEIIFRQAYVHVWSDAGSGSHRDGWAFIVDPKTIPKGFKVLGHHMQSPGAGHPNGKHQTILVRDVSEKKNALKAPEGLSWIWDDRGSGADQDIQIYAMNAPDGYYSLGTLLRVDGGAGRGAGTLPPGEMTKEALSQYACVRADLVDSGKITDLLWNEAGSGAAENFSAWGVTYVNPVKPDGSMRLSVGSFVGEKSHAKPEKQRALVLRIWMPRDVERLQEWMNRASKGR